MNIIDMRCLMGDGIYLNLSPDDLVRQMDRNGVSQSVISTVDQYVTVYNREGNDQIISAIRSFPDRLIGFAVANPWYGEKALDELDRCFSEGLHGLTLDTHLQSCFFTDEIVRNLISHGERLGMTIYCHTGTPIHSFPLGLMELALEFPNTRFILGSVGYADGWYEVIPAAQSASNIYVETSHGSIQILETLIRDLGAERVLFGSNTPVSTIASELRKIKLLELPDADRSKILGENATKMIGGDI